MPENSFISLVPGSRRRWRFNLDILQRRDRKLGLDGRRRAQRLDDRIVQDVENGSRLRSGRQQRWRCGSRGRRQHDLIAGDGCGRRRDDGDGPLEVGREVAGGVVVGAARG